MEDYGLALKLLRIHFKYTQREIAEKVGFSHHALSKWENGVNQPDIHALRNICALYNITTEDFFRIASGVPIEKVIQENVIQENVEKSERRCFMDCKKCGASAVDNAVYCHNCGERIDGKKTCPTCGSLNEEGYKFCIHCGERIDGRTVCKVCGAEYEGTYCPQCGTNNAAKRAKRCANKAHTGVYAKIMKIVSVALGLTAALAAVIFMFFLCFEEETSIFYYFKDSFKDLKEIKDMTGGEYYSGAINALGYTYTIATCVIAAVTLASVATFVIFTVIRSVKAFCGKATRSPLSMATLTVFCYVLGAALLYGLESGELDGEKFRFNNATIAGLIVCGVAFVGTVVCAMLSDLKKFKNKNFIARLICAGACIVIGTVAIVLVSNAQMKTVLNLDSAVHGNLLANSFSVPPLQSATVILGMFSQLYAGSFYQHLKFEMNMVSTFGILGAAFMLAAIVFGLLALFRNIRNCNEKKNGNGMLWAILSFVCMVGVLIFEILLARQAAFIVDTTDIEMGVDVILKLEMKMVRTIVALVFAFVNMGIAIAAKVLSLKYRKRDNG